MNKMSRNSLEVESLPALHVNQVTRRKSAMDGIRESLRCMPLISKNHLMVETKRLHNKSDSNLSQTEDKSQNGEKHSISISELFEEKYQVFEKLGQGSSGVVYRCRHRESGDIFAAKSFSHEDEHVPGLKQNFFVQKSLKHPCVISYEALFLDLKKHMGWLVMEFIDWPSLDKIKIKNEEELRVIMQQLLEALNYLHKSNIVHRDIKPDNIMYDPVKQMVKIIDFGISRKNKKRNMSFDMWTITGTLFYRAPQMFSGGYQEGVDIWAAGVMLYQIISGQTPFQSEYHHKTIKNISEAELYFPPCFERYSFELTNLIRRMINRDINQRPTASTLLKDIWFYPLPSHLSPHPGSLNFISFGPVQNKRPQNVFDQAESPKSVRSLESPENEMPSFEEMRSNSSGFTFKVQKIDGYFYSEDNCESTKEVSTMKNLRF